MGYFDFLNPSNWFGGGGSSPQYDPYQVDPGMQYWAPGQAWGNQAAGGYGQVFDQLRQTGQIDTTQADESRGLMGQLARGLFARARGEGTSVAEEQMKQALERSRANAASIAASSPGVDAGTAMAQAQRAQEETALQGARDTSLLRAQEQLATEQALGGLLGNMRGQDIGLATSQAQLGLQEQGMRDQLASQFMSMGMSQAEADRRAWLQIQAMRQQESQFAGSLAQQAWLAQQGFDTQRGGTLLGGAGALLGGLL